MPPTMLGGAACVLYSIARLFLKACNEPEAPVLGARCQKNHYDDLDVSLIAFFRMEDGRGAFVPS
eukprot:561245-Amphidinium_carterae.2